LISVSHLTKVYGNHTAVDDLSFNIEKGRIYGFLGPNGAGKSTTMNIITGCLAATSGEVKIGDYDIFEQPLEAKKLIGYLPELPPLYMDMTPIEYLKFVASAKGLKGNEQKDEIVKVLDITKLWDVKYRLIKNLSKGYRQRVGIAQALLGHPEVIILDEPTVGLDPKQIIEIRDLIRELGKEHTVILSSHILSEVSAVCDEIMIISKGRLVASDTAENLATLFAGRRSIRLSVHADAETALYILANVDGIEKTEVLEDNRDGVSCLRISEANGSESVPESIAASFINSGIALHEMALEKASLEDIFLELTGDNSPLDEGEMPEDTPQEASTDTTQKEVYAE